MPMAVSLSPKIRRVVQAVLYETLALAFVAPMLSWLFGRSGALGPLEWPLYVGATGRRWVRMVLRSKDRSALLGYGRQGLREAAAAPRTTTAVLAGTPVAPDVAAVEAGAGRG